MSRVAMVQSRSSTDEENNLAKAEMYIKECVKENAQFVIFPEYFMTYYPQKDDNYLKRAQTLEGAFVTSMRNLAETYGVWIVFGMNELSKKKGNRSYNTIVIVNDKGKIKGSYRKTHLFDAFSCKESEDTIPGKHLFEPIETPIGKVGIATCYDLRFPEVARYAAINGAQVMIYPSAWVDGEKKFMQWKALLRARAIENGMFVLGCSHVSDKTYMGKSIAVAPDGEILVRGEKEEQVLFTDIKLRKVEKIREKVPTLKNRRTDLY